MTRSLFDFPAEPRQSVPNPLLAHDPELVARLSAFRPVAVDHLLNALMHRDCNLDIPGPLPHSREDAQAVAIVLRVLTKPEWTERDLDQFDAYWRMAWHTDLFGNEFESDRFRIQNAITTGRGELAGPAPETYR